ncbi:cardiomyopathy-associated protein 5 [Thunnus thynnus]|uniref:cardiomyopathy-associated protein 5 n=1 Tax=Thunnus thynnus TaxID=8237 RepID=UPI003526D5AB
MEEYESLDADMTELQDFQCGPSDSISQDDEDEVEELHNSLREVVQDQSVKPKLQCLMVDPSFSMVTVQSEDSGIVWETASSRCSTPWASETSSLSEACSMEGSGAAGKITIVFDEDKIIRRRTRSGGRSSRLGDRLSRPGSSRSASALGVERPEMAEVSLPNVKQEKTETESDLEEIKNKDQQLFSLISEGYEILNIRVPSKLPTVDEEESTEMQDNLSYLDQTPKIKSRNHQTWTKSQDDVLPEDMEILDHQEPSKQDSSQSITDTELRNTPTPKEHQQSTSDIDYFEKFTLLDEVVPGEQAPELQEEVEHPAVKPQAEEQKPATETATDSQSASEDSFVFVTDVEIVGEHLDEVFYGGGAPANELHQREDDEAKDETGMRTRRESQRQLKENGSVLFGSEESVLTPIYISPGPPKIIDPILLEEPTAMSFMYSDLYKDAVGERRRSDEEYSEPESVTSEKSFKRSLSDSEEADGYLEKFTLKDETPTVEVQSESVEDNKEGKMIWSQSKFEMTGCLTRAVEEEDKDEIKYGEPKVQGVSNEEMREDLQEKGEIVTETEKEREEIQISTVTEEQTVRLASEESIQESKLTEEKMQDQEVKHDVKRDQTEPPESHTDEPLPETQQVDKETEKTGESVEHQREEPAEKASEQSVIESEQPCQTQQETKKTAEVLEEATEETAVKAAVSTEVPQTVIKSEIQTETTEKSLYEEAATDFEMVAADEKEIIAAKTEEETTDTEMVAADEKDITVTKTEEETTDTEMVPAYEKEITAVKTEEVATDTEMIAADEKEIIAVKTEEETTDTEMVAADEKDITVTKTEEETTDTEMVAAYEKEITAVKTEEVATDFERVAAYEKEITAVKTEEVATDTEMVAAYEKEITAVKTEEVATDTEMVAADEKEITAVKTEKAATDTEMVAAYEKEITAVKTEKAATDTEMVAAYEKEITAVKTEEVATDFERVAADEKEIIAAKTEEETTDTEMVAAYEKEITAVKTEEETTDTEMVAADEKEITAVKTEKAATDTEMVAAYEKEITAAKTEEVATDTEMVAAYEKEITVAKTEEEATDTEMVAAYEKEIIAAKTEKETTDTEMVAAYEKEITAAKTEEEATDTEMVAAYEKEITAAKTETPAEVKELETIRQEMFNSTEFSLEIEASAETSLFKEEEAVAPEKAPVEDITDCEPVVHAVVEITEKTVDEKEVQTKVHIDLQEVTSAEATAVQTAVPEGEKRQEASIEKIVVESPKFVPETDQESEVKTETLSEVTEPLMPDEVMTDSDKNEHEILETEKHQQDKSAAGSETEKTKLTAETRAKTPTEDTRTAVQDLGDELILLVPKGRAVEMDIEIGQHSGKITKSHLSELDNTCKQPIASENTTVCSEDLQEAMKETIAEPQLEEEPEEALKQEALLTNELDRSYSPATPVEEADVEEQKTDGDLKEDKAVFSPLRSFTPQEDLSELHREDVEAAEVEEKAEMYRAEDSPEINIMTEYISPEIVVHREDVGQKIEQDEAVAEGPEVTEEEPEYEMISKQDAREITEPEIQRDAEEPRPESGQEREERMEMKAETEQKVLDLSANEELIEDDYEIIDAEEEIQARLAAELQGMDWFCLTCECLLSKDDCESGEHHSHQVTAVDKAYEEIKERLGDWISELQGRSENIEDLVSELELAYNSVEDHCVEAEAAMVVQNEEMMALVMQQYNNMSVNMEEEKKTKLEQLYDQIVSFQESIDTAKATLETTAREAETDARSPEDIHARLKAALESAMSLELGPRGLLVFEDYAKGNSSSSNLTQRKGIPVPQRPTLQPQEPGSATSTNVTVYWKINPGDIIDCFQVYCMEDPQGAVSEEYRVTVKESYCVLEELEPDKTYKVWVMAVNYTGCSLPSERLCFRTAPSVPVIDTERCTVTWDSAMLRWSPGTQTGQSYTLEYCRQYELEGEGLRSISGIKSCEHRVLLQPNENYLFYIKAVNEAGASEQSEAALISTKGTRFHLLKDSAHPALELSADETTLHYSQDTYEHVPPTDKQCPSILGELLPARGHYYWETIVSGSEAYRLGVAYSTANKNSPLGEDSLSWCLQCIPSPSGCRYQLLHNDVQSSVFAIELPERVGILLDYQLGRLSFYNAQSGQLLGTFSQRLTQMCHPALALEMPGHLEVSMVPEVPEFAKDS